MRCWIDGCLLFFFLLAQPVLASAQESQCLLENLIEVKLNNGSELSCAEQMKLDEFFGELMERSPLKANRLSIVLQQSEENNGNYQFPSTINLNYSPENLNWKAVAAHEFGHHIFALAVIAKSFNLKLATEAFERLSIAKANTSQIDSPKVRDDSDLVRLVRTTLNENKTLMGKAIDELYADIYAAVFFDDPEIMAKVFSSEGRNFLLSTERCYTVDSHCQLDSVRLDLWRQFVEPRINDKQLLLSTLATEIAKVFLAARKRGNSGEYDRIANLEWLEDQVRNRYHLSPRKQNQ